MIHKPTVLFLLMMLLCLGSTDICRPETTPTATSKPDPVEPAANLTGSYRSPDGNLELQMKTSSLARFYLSAFHGDHFGEVCGELTLDGNKAVYRKGECEIRFEFTPEYIQIHQISLDAACDFGANVTATGKYIRKSDKPDFSMCP